MPCGSDKTVAGSQNPKFSFKDFSAVHLLYGALFSTWVALFQIEHCCFACTKSHIFFKKRNDHFLFVFFYFLNSELQKDGKDNKNVVWLIMYRVFTS